MVVLSPLLLLLALLIYWKIGHPVLFIQIRSGKGTTPFRMVKFRTMTDERDDNGNLLPDEQRLTPFGRFLRATSLDELPQLWNVFKGDMSLVGPRPMMVEYLPHYSSAQMRRFEVLPGITGWAQVNGRNSLSWESKFAYDVWYVDHRSFWLDLRILWRTAGFVLLRRGINTPGHTVAVRLTDHVRQQQGTEEADA
jgi:lipopolysaccharide/colanic/teichoic acid biosynthesis glycosyltransferase